MAKYFFKRRAISFCMVMAVLGVLVNVHGVDGVTPNASSLSSAEASRLGIATIRQFNALGFNLSNLRSFLMGMWTGRNFVAYAPRFLEWIDDYYKAGVPRKEDQGLYEILERATYTQTKQLIKEQAATCPGKAIQLFAYLDQLFEVHTVQDESNKYHFRLPLTRGLLGLMAINVCTPAGKRCAFDVIEEMRAEIHAVNTQELLKIHPKEIDDAITLLAEFDLGSLPHTLRSKLLWSGVGAAGAGGAYYLSRRRLAKVYGAVNQVVNFLYDYEGALEKVTEKVTDTAVHNLSRKHRPELEHALREVITKIKEGELDFLLHEVASAELHLEMWNRLVRLESNAPSISLQQIIDALPNNYQADNPLGRDQESRLKKLMGVLRRKNEGEQVQHLRSALWRPLEDPERPHAIQVALATILAERP
jgi:hypothetical protein